MNCPDCERDGVSYYARGLCSMCYYRRRNAGRPLPEHTRNIYEIDEVKIDRVLAGDYRGPVRPAERTIVVAVGTRRGLPAYRLAELLGCTPRTVFRHRRALVAA